MCSFLFIILHFAVYSSCMTFLFVFLALWSSLSFLSLYSLEISRLALYSQRSVMLSTKMKLLFRLHFSVILICTFLFQKNTRLSHDIVSWNYSSLLHDKQQFPASVYSQHPAVLQHFLSVLQERLRYLGDLSFDTCILCSIITIRAIELSNYFWPFNSFLLYLAPLFSMGSLLALF